MTPAAYLFGNRNRFLTPPFVDDEDANARPKLQSAPPQMPGAAAVNGPDPNAALSRDLSYRFGRDDQDQVPQATPSPLSPASPRPTMGPEDLARVQTPGAPQALLGTRPRLVMPGSQVGKVPVENPNLPADYRPDATTASRPRLTNPVMQARNDYFNQVDQHNHTGFWNRLGHFAKGAGIGALQGGASGGLGGALGGALTGGVMSAVNPRTADQMEFNVLKLPQAQRQYGLQQQFKTDQLNQRLGEARAEDAEAQTRLRNAQVEAANEQWMHVPTADGVLLYNRKTGEYRDTGYASRAGNDTVILHTDQGLVRYNKRTGQSEYIKDPSGKNLMPYSASAGKIDAPTNQALRSTASRIVTDLFGPKMNELRQGQRQAAVDANPRVGELQNQISSLQTQQSRITDQDDLTGEKRKALGQQVNKLQTQLEQERRSAEKVGDDNHNANVQRWEDLFHEELLSRQRNGQPLRAEPGRAPLTDDQVGAVAAAKGLSAEDAKLFLRGLGYKLASEKATPGQAPANLNNNRAQRPKLTPGPPLRSPTLGLTPEMVPRF